MSVREVKEQRDTQAFTVRMPSDVYEAVRVLSFATSQSMNEIVVHAVGDYMADKGHRDSVDALARTVIDRYQVALDKLADL